MIYLNKYLILIIAVLLPITIISFPEKETNFIVPEKKEIKEIIIKVNKNNKILEVPLEEYVTGVVAGEMPASFELEALKAQALAARTYVIKHLEKKDIIASTTAAQVYLTKEELQKKWQNNYQKYYEKITQATTETKNQIITYDNQPIIAYYFSRSNGYTESSINVFKEERQYLNVVESKWDKDNSHTIKIAKKEFCDKLSINCDEIIISNIKKDNSNRIEIININNKTFTGIELRKKLSLRSTDFDIKINKEDLEITTRGYGHGVGMSQYGANFMAKDGYNYEQIIKYYYQNVEITNI